jgi:hypothetical protein
MATASRRLQGQAPRRLAPPVSHTVRPTFHAAVCEEPMCLLRLSIGSMPCDEETFHSMAQQKDDDD